jgi:hypothetical protein
VKKHLLLPKVETLVLQTVGAAETTLSDRLIRSGRPCLPTPDSNVRSGAASPEVTCTQLPGAGTGTGWRAAGALRKGGHENPFHSTSRAVR